MTITTIIPNFNGSNLIKKNLPKVISVMGKYKANIIIVDDYSVESDYLKVKEFITSLGEKKESITLLRNNKNYGFSKTVNTGANATDSDLLFFLNSDVIPEPNFLDSVISKFKNDEKLFAVGCMDKSIEDGKTILRGRGVGKFERGFLMHSKGELSKNNTLWVSGGSSVMRNLIFKKLGGFDELYNPFYWEDIDLSYRALKSGYTIEFDKTSIVEHRHEDGAIKKNISPQRVKTIAYRNQILFVWKTITDTKFILEHILYLPYHIIRSIFHREWEFLKGFLMACAVYPQVVRHKSISKKLYKKSDYEVLAEFV